MLLLRIANNNTSSSVDCFIKIARKPYQTTLKKKIIIIININLK